MKVQSALRRRRTDRQRGGVASGLLLAAMTGVLFACAEAPVARPVPVTRPAAQIPAARVYVYPASGQSREQLDRDRYECYLWAVRQSGFDPSQPQAAPHQRIEVVPMPPPGSGTVAGAATGAIVGAVVSHPHDTGTGAAVGAVAGAIIGATADSARQEQADRVQRAYDARDAQLVARLERQSNEYRRAISACLEGRGYTVK